MATFKGFPLEMLTRDQLEEIHRSTLIILERTGLKVESEEVLKLLADFGAKVNFKNYIVKFPPNLVETAIKKAPKSFTWYGRGYEKNIKMEGTNVYFGGLSLAQYVIDLDGRRRPATVQDAENFSRIIDALDNMLEAHCIVTPRDVPVGTVHAYMILAMAKNTEKCMVESCYGGKMARDTIRMCEVIAGGERELRERPIIVGIFNPVSPLILYRNLLEGSLEYIKKGLPVIFASMAMSGATSPITIAGTLVQCNAEVLGAIIIAQLVRPGTPVVYGTVNTSMDMKTGTIALSSVETGIFNIAFAQLARFYNLPSRGTGGIGASKTLDMQAGYETALMAFMAGFAGINYILGAAGSLESGMTASYEKLVIDEEILGMVNRAFSGIEVNEETMAVDLINEVGPEGHYFDKRHTMKFLRSEHYIPELCNRMSYDTWKKAGEKDIREAAKEKVRRILAEHRPRPLDPHVERELVRIKDEIEERVRREGGADAEKPM